MSDWKKQMGPRTRRKLARVMRAKLRQEPAPSMTDVAAASGVSRTYAYKLVEELETWESKVTFKEEAADLAAVRYEPLMWMFMSGPMIMANIQGEIGNDIFNIPGELGQSEDISDPLLK
jgi:hypothetical protein